MNSEEVFNAICNRLEARSNDLFLIAKAGCSFEEWLNWEAFLACHTAARTVHPRPAYKMHCESKEFGDLLVVEAVSGEELLIETAVIHDWTGDKWINKVNGDTGKLLRLAAACVPTLQLVVVASAKGQVSTSEGWQKWLAKTQVWQRPTSLERRFSLGRDGEVVIRGWTLSGNDIPAGVMNTVFAEPKDELEMSQLNAIAPAYQIVHFADIPGVPCPCGTARRAFGDVADYPATIHVTEISVDAVTHYHKRQTETYYILECASDAKMELDGELHPIRPGSCILIPPGVRHRAVGQMKIINIVIPKFDPEDEYFDAP